MTTLHAEGKCKLIPFLMGINETIEEYQIQYEGLVIGRFLYCLATHLWTLNIRSDVRLTRQFMDEIWTMLLMETNMIGGEDAN